MAAHRYWRLVSLGLPTGGSFLEISELQVLDETSTNVTASATKTASTNPDVAGALADIFDGNLSTRCTWSDTVALAAAFWIKFDFSGGDVDIRGVKQGGFDTANRSLERFKLQFSDDDSTWTTLNVKNGLAYPGNNTLSSLYAFDPTPLANCHRYWRLKSLIEVGGIGLQLTELQVLEDHVTVIRYATKTSVIAPSSGSLGGLYDGNLVVPNGWSEAEVEDPTFALVFDFSGDKATAITGVKQARAAGTPSYMTGFALEYSDNGTDYTPFGSVSGITDPGETVLSAEIEVSEAVASAAHRFFLAM
jgi:large exoprotein involved in heme utilization and adhesion